MESLLTQLITNMICWLSVHCCVQGLHSISALEISQWGLYTCSSIWCSHRCWFSAATGQVWNSGSKASPARGRCTRSRCDSSHCPGSVELTASPSAVLHGILAWVTAQGTLTGCLQPNCRHTPLKIAFATCVYAVLSLLRSVYTDSIYSMTTCVFTWVQAWLFPNVLYKQPMFDCKSTNWLINLLPRAWEW